MDSNNILEKEIKLPFPGGYSWAELIGAAFLLLIGLSLVILMFGSGSPVAQLIPSERARHVLTGFLFGSTGASIALSHVGKKVAQINPVVTMVFWLFRKIVSRTAIVYVLAQLTGAIVG